LQHSKFKRDARSVSANQNNYFSLSLLKTANDQGWFIPSIKRRWKTCQTATPTVCRKCLVEFRAVYV